MTQARGALLLLVALALLPLAAMASPTDPTWIGGIYDAADGDDEITLVLDMTAPGIGAAAEPVVQFWWSTDLMQPDATADQRPGSRHRERGPPDAAAMPSANLPATNPGHPISPGSSPLRSRPSTPTMSITPGGVRHGVGKARDGFATSGERVGHTEYILAFSWFP
jgi:hypothetical protein